MEKEYKPKQISITFYSYANADLLAGITINNVFYNKFSKFGVDYVNRADTLEEIDGKYYTTDLPIKTEIETWAGSAGSYYSGTLTTTPPVTISLPYFETYKDDAYMDVLNIETLEEIRVTHNTPITINYNAQIFFRQATCLEYQTLITMSDGSQKKICEIKPGEKIMSTTDPINLNLVEDEVVFSDSDVIKTHLEKDIWTFDDNTTITTVHPHEFFNLRTNKMEYIADFIIGEDRIKKQDGSTPLLIKHEVVKEETRHNTIFTKTYNNYFANGILTGNRHTKFN